MIMLLIVLLVILKLYNVLNVILDMKCLMDYVKKIVEKENIEIIMVFVKLVFIIKNNVLKNVLKILPLTLLLKNV